MAARLHTYVTFVADFPQKNPVDGAPAKELAGWLAEHLRERGIEVESVEDVDFGFDICCRGGAGLYRVSVTYDEIETRERWSCQICPPPPTWRDRLARRNSAWMPDGTRLALALHDSLRNSSRVRDVQWFAEFDPCTRRGAQPVYAEPTAEAPVRIPKLSPAEQLHRSFESTISGTLPGQFTVVAGVICGIVVFAVTGKFVLALVGFGPVIWLFAGISLLLGLNFWFNAWDIWTHRDEIGRAVGTIRAAINLAGGLMFALLAASAVLGLGDALRRAL